MGGVVVAAETGVGADLLDEGRDDGRRGRVPDAEIGVPRARVFAAADFR